LAAYAVCVERGRVLLARRVSPVTGDTQWTLPGGKVERAEDPFHTVIRELAPEPSGETAESVWTPIAEVAGLRRSPLVDVGLALARTLLPTGHVTRSRSAV
jgi:hypothetical protein